MEKSSLQENDPPADPHPTAQRVRPVYVHGLREGRRLEVYHRLHLAARGDVILMPICLFCAENRQWNIQGREKIT
jgi:hypothetical protein